MNGHRRPAPGRPNGVSPGHGHGPVQVQPMGYRQPRGGCISGIVAALLILAIGGFCTMIFPLAGLFALVGAVAVLVMGVVRSMSYRCSRCGNSVSDTSSLCPACGSNLAPADSTASIWTSLVCILVAAIVSAWVLRDRWEPIVTPLLRKWLH